MFNNGDVHDDESEGDNNDKEDDRDNDDVERKDTDECSSKIDDYCAYLLVCASCIICSFALSLATLI